MAGTASSPLYVPGPPPNDPKALPRYLYEEFQKLQRTVSLLAAGHIDTSYAAPAKPRDGDIRLADGIDWDPVLAGAPRFVGYYAGAWHSLG